MWLMKNNVFLGSKPDRHVTDNTPHPPLPSSVCIILSLCFMWQLWQHQMLLGDTKQKHENMSTLFSSSDRQPHNYFHNNVKTPIVNYQLKAPRKNTFLPIYCLTNQNFPQLPRLKWTKGHQNHSEARHPSLSRWVSIWQKKYTFEPHLVSQ